MSIGIATFSLLRSIVTVIIRLEKHLMAESKSMSSFINLKSTTWLLILVPLHTPLSPDPAWNGERLISKEIKWKDVDVPNQLNILDYLQISFMIKSQCEVFIQFIQK